MILIFGSFQASGFALHANKVPAKQFASILHIVNGSDAGITKHLSIKHTNSHRAIQSLLFFVGHDFEKSRN